MAGLQRAWGEKAFRLEVGITAILLPASAFLATSFIEFALLISSLAAVLVVELLNTAIEAIVDRVGLEWNQLSMHAKDLGSAAVLVSLGAAGVLWAAALLRFLLR